MIQSDFGFSYRLKISTEFNHATPDEVKTNVPIPEQEVTQSAPVAQAPRSEAHGVFFKMMSKRYSSFLQTHIGAP